MGHGGDLDSVTGGDGRDCRAEALLDRSATEPTAHWSDSALFDGITFD